MRTPLPTPRNCPPSTDDIAALVEARVAAAEERWAKQMAEHERMGIGVSLVACGPVLLLGIAIGLRLG